jgi:methylenetetrahydrofolate--tRNA-(uracil-5-)-methyltransferase
MAAKLKVIGAGLAGAEAAWQAARQGAEVELWEMKPVKRTPAHHTDSFAELCCSNSLRSNQLSNAVGVLKEELRLLDSLVMEAAYATQVPAGGALAVNRDDFSLYITEKIKQNPAITVHEGEVIDLDPAVPTVVATGPLTSDPMAETIRKLLGGGEMHFYDAAAPIVDYQSIDTSRAFFASRYGKGNGDDYLNCPMSKDEYDAFYDALCEAEVAELKEFDKAAQRDLTVFEGCMPVEVMAKRGRDTLRFGPMKPVGLPVPETGHDAYATVQLRRENTEGTMYNLVGFQTHLTFPEQRRVFRMIPGLENAEFLRYGVMHRNTYLNSPGLLDKNYSAVAYPNLFFAGQMTGVEGYVESAGSGFIAGTQAARKILGLPLIPFDDTTILGAMAQYVSRGTNTVFQPMNANFGIVAPLEKKVKGGKKMRNEAYAERALNHIRAIRDQYYQKT